MHERDKDTDFCLLVVRKLLHTNSPHVKVVLMSATFEAAYFARYFSTHLSGSIEIPPIIKVEGSPHQVHEFFLDDIAGLGEVSYLRCFWSSVKSLLSLCSVSPWMLTIPEQTTAAMRWWKNC